MGTYLEIVAAGSVRERFRREWISRDNKFNSTCRGHVPAVVLAAAVRRALGVEDAVGGLHGRVLLDHVVLVERHGAAWGNARQTRIAHRQHTYNSTHVHLCTWAGGISK